MGYGGSNLSWLSARQGSYLMYYFSGSAVALFPSRDLTILSHYEYEVNDIKWSSLAFPRLYVHHCKSFHRYLHTDVTFQLMGELHTVVPGHKNPQGAWFQSAHFAMVLTYHLFTWNFRSYSMHAGAFTSEYGIPSPIYVIISKLYILKLY